MKQKEKTEVDGTNFNKSISDKLIFTFLTDLKEFSKYYNFMKLILFLYKTFRHRIKIRYKFLLI